MHGIVKWGQIHAHTDMLTAILFSLINQGKQARKIQLRGGLAITLRTLRIGTQTIQRI
jgi:hypothetical protein